MVEINATLRDLKPGGPREFSVMMGMFYTYCELRMPPAISVTKDVVAIKPSHYTQPPPHGAPQPHPGNSGWNQRIRAI